MTLPEYLQEAIEKELSVTANSQLRNARADLTERYRERTTGYMTTQNMRLSYLATRFPATYAVVTKVLSEIPDIDSMTSMLDLGAGPGTATFAFKELNSGAAHTLVEQDNELIQLGKKLGVKEKWIHSDISRYTPASFDLVIASYVLNELSKDQQEKLIDTLWSSFTKYLVLIEPGTPFGFEIIKRLRQKMLDKGGFVCAPCPHNSLCPEDWCHFAQRVERSKLHRNIKGADKSYEDEKFSYIIISKKQLPLPEGRIIRHPNYHSGHIDFIVCTREGIQKKIISKKSGEVFKRAKKLSWGDQLNNSE